MIAENTFYESCHEEEARIDVDVSNPFEDKDFDRITKEARAACPAGPRRVEHVKRLIDRYVAAESDKCAVDAAWLLARGETLRPSLTRRL